MPQKLFNPPRSELAKKVKLPGYEKSFLITALNCKISGQLPDLGSMKLTKIDDNFSVSPQISVEDLLDIKAAGFRSVICNRPDSEDGGAHPDHNLLESAAREAGLEFAYLPVVPGQINDAQVARFKLAIDELPGPILGYCRLGIRSKVLYEHTR